jgi:hypothetical protein
MVALVVSCQKTKQPLKSMRLDHQGLLWAIPHRAVNAQHYSVLQLSQDDAVN